MHRATLAIWTVIGAVLASLCPPTLADVSYPAKPGQRDFIYDGAKLLTPDDAAAIKALADKLLTDKDVVLIVATIDSLSGFGASGWPIERYAMNLFDEWGIGRADHNYGMLLLVSKGDRKARIELGKAFNRERDEACAQIMSGTIIPRFKQGDFSGGIKAGALALDGLARGTVPAPPTRRPAPAVTSSTSTPPPSQPSHIVQYAPSPLQRGITPSFAGPLVCVGIGFVVVIALIVIIVARRSMGGGYSGGGYGGGGGWGWGGGGWGSSMPPWWWWMPGPGSWNSGGGIFGGSSGSTHTHDSGGFSSGGMSGGGFGGGGGGSFGGGFSGGGGSTGSW